jgi:hypothetical protein
MLLYSNNPSELHYFVPRLFRFTSATAPIIGFDAHQPLTAMTPCFDSVPDSSPSKSMRLRLDSRTHSPASHLLKPTHTVLPPSSKHWCIIGMSWWVDAVMVCMRALAVQRLGDKQPQHSHLASAMVLIPSSVYIDQIIHSDSARPHGNVN